MIQPAHLFRNAAIIAQTKFLKWFYTISIDDQIIIKYLDYQVT